MGNQQKTDIKKTGWPAGLLQDDSRELSRWLASRIDARYVLRKGLFQGVMKMNDQEYFESLLENMDPLRRRVVEALAEMEQSAVVEIVADELIGHVPEEILEQLIQRIE